MNSDLSERILRRLVYAKRLYMHGIGHMDRETQIDMAMAVLNFDNSVEMLLSTSLTYNGKEVPFHFDNLLEKFYGILEEKETGISTGEIKSLHSARNKVQHEGIVPSMGNVKEYRNITEKVLEKGFSKIFGIDFFDVSLGLLIENEMVKELYRRGEQKYYEGNFRESIVYLVSAFEKAKTKEQAKLHGSGLDLALMGKLGDKTLEKVIRTIAEELEVLKLRLDYKKFQKYRELFPTEIKARNKILGPKDNSVEKEEAERIKEIIETQTQHN